MIRPSKEEVSWLTKKSLQRAVRAIKTMSLSRHPREENKERSKILRANQANMSTP
jgi:hypothetical protein